MLNIEEFGNRIKIERKRHKLTLEKEEAILNISRQPLANGEKGKGNGPQTFDLLRMCELFGCDFGYLVGEYSERTRQATDIVAATGLDSKAVEQLCSAQKDRYWFVIQALNELLKYDNLRLLDLIGQYVMMDEHETIELNDGEKIDKGVLYSRKIEQELVKLRSSVQQKERGQK